MEETETLQQMRQSGTTYCDLIEDTTLNKTQWLTQVEKALARLHYSIIDLLPAPIDKNYPMTPNFERRFELYSQLRDKLGEDDQYTIGFDSDLIETLSGSVADDLTDIYCELKYGLVQLDDHAFSDSEVIEHWTNSYHLHWGQHLVDANRHFYSLRIKGIF